MLENIRIKVLNALDEYKIYQDKKLRKVDQKKDFEAILTNAKKVGWLNAGPDLNLLNFLDIMHPEKTCLVNLKNKTAILFK
jgi:hypothetical protein